MSGEDTASELAVVSERLHAVQGDVTEIKQTVKCFDNREMAFEKHYIKEHARLVHKTDAAHKRLDNHDNQLSDIKAQLLILTKSIQPLIVTNKFLGWMGGVLGISILLLIWMIIIGQVTLVYK